MLAGGGIVAGYLLWQKNQSVVSGLLAHDSRLEQRLGGLDNRAAAIEQQLQQLASANQDIEPSLATLRQTLDQKIAALKEENKAQISQEFAILQSAVNALQAKLEEKKPLERKPLWEPAEAEYLIRIANDSLTLRGDVATALAALRAADQRLQAVGHPAFATTRRLLAEEINALLAVPQADIAAAANTLSSLQQRVTELPLRGRHATAAPAEVAQESEPPAEELTGWRGFLHDIWQALKELVTVRRRDVSDEPLMAPERVLYLGQNLQLKLETAHLALLRGDEGAYHGALKTAAQWLERYYDGDDAAVREVRETLGRLDKIVVKPELPSLKASLEAIREVLASRAYLSARQLPLGLAANNQAQGWLPAVVLTVKGGEQP
ncbi:MAG: uroporphyrinogen-III C-methyltransferase [Gammaproteobacteria bacterium]